MDRKVFYEKIKGYLLKVASVPLIKKKREIDTRKVTFEDLWDILGKGQFTGYISAASTGYKWYTFMIKGRIKFSAFWSKRLVLRGRESLLSMKNKWNNPPVNVILYEMTEEALKAYYGVFSGVKVFDEINPETIGLDKVFSKLSEEKFTGTAIFDVKTNKIVFLWYEGKIIHIFPQRNIELSVDESTLEEVLLAPFLNITAIKSHNMSLDLPYEKLLYTKRSGEINRLLKCLQDKLKDVISNRVVYLIGFDTKKELVKRHPFYEDLLIIKEGEIQIEPKVIDRGITRDFDEVVKEIFEVYLSRATEDAGRYLVKKVFTECEKKGDEGEENN